MSYSPDYKKRSDERFRKYHMSLSFEDKLDELDDVAERNYFDEVDSKLDYIRRLKDKVVEISMCAGYVHDINDPLFGDISRRMMETKNRHRQELQDIIEEAKTIAAKEIKKIIR